MASSTSTTATAATRNPRKPLGFLKNAKQRKHSFIQFFAMSGILLLSVRSLGQKYRINDLLEDTTALREERDTLTSRMDEIKRGLRREASLEPSGLFAARLRSLFGDN
ncbi:hypothetical protein SAY87_005737 [Trapa incisa]|uniref:Uncharacterized protein n=2 Tax=Trapa TaxID=22665 RepID=A0AAN7KSI3_TRANT|nr:hypothetical protein SAY87_005737 [Trapa incisa]KAK4772331.1 hypothetical protein SAY86_014106 [Trapa natans]